MKYLLLTLLVGITLFLSGVDANAADTTKGYQPLTGIYGITDNQDHASGDARLTNMISNAFNLLIGFAGIAAVVMISYGAILYMGESITKKGDGRNIMWNAVIGLLLVLFTYTILFTINPDILKIKISPKKIEMELSARAPEGYTTVRKIITTQQEIADCETKGGTVSKPTATDTNTYCSTLSKSLTTEELQTGERGIMRGKAGAIQCAGSFNAPEVEAFEASCKSQSGTPTRAPTRSIVSPDGKSSTWYASLCGYSRIISVPSGTTLSTTTCREHARFGTKTCTPPEKNADLQKTDAYKVFSSECASLKGGTVQHVPGPDDRLDSGRLVNVAAKFACTSSGSIWSTDPVIRCYPSKN